jgi:cyclic pyranopterin monophosphate synthase
MKNRKLSHVDNQGNPAMVDVSTKKITLRTAEAQAIVNVGKKIINQIQNNELITKKGPVFQTSIISGVMAAKRTAELIPFCHPLSLEDCQVRITSNKEKIIITTFAKLEGKTGVEMEVLTAASVAALTIYDMCKALSHDIVIEEVKLLAKTGGKQDFKRK